MLFFVVVRALWGKPLWMALAGGAGFLFVDLAFLGANLPKIPTGGWFPLVVALVVYVLLTTWRRGREIVTRNRIEEEGPLLDFVTGLQESPDPPVRVPGTAVFLNADEAMYVEHNHVLHEHVVVLTIKTRDVPHVPDSERVEVDDLLIPDDGIVTVTASFGYQDEPNVPAALRLAVEQGVTCDVDEASYFLSRITIRPVKNREMARWRKRLFTTITHNTSNRAAYFGLPDERVVAFGSNIEV